MMLKKDQMVLFFAKNSSMLMNEKYTFVAKAKTDVTILNLNSQTLEEARTFIDELEIAIYEGQDFVTNEGMPICDFTKTAIRCLCNQKTCN